MSNRNEPPAVCRTCGTRKGNSPTLPTDIKAELSMIGSVLLDPNELDETAAIASPDDCVSPEVADLFRVMLALRAEGRSFDVAVLRDRLIANGKPAEVADEFLLRAEQAVPYGVHAKHYASSVRNAARRRLAALAGLDLNDKARDLSEDLDAVLGQAETELHRVLEGGATEQRDLTVFAAAAEAMQALDSDLPAGLETGLADFDRLSGGLQPGSFTIIGARPSVGKTMVLAAILQHCAKHGTPGLLFSIEQSRQEIVQRLVSSIAQVSSEVWKRRVKPTADERRSMDRAVDCLQEWPVFVDDRSDQTLARIRATTRLSVRRHHVGLVLIDYLQLISPADTKIPREQQIATITRGLKLMARELNIPVVLACQLNRDVEKRVGGRPQLSDLRESGAIEQDADIVILLDGSKLQDHQPTGTLTLRVAKHRNGQRGDIDVILDRDTMTIRNAARGWQTEPFEEGPEF